MRITRNFIISAIILMAAALPSESFCQPWTAPADSSQLYHEHYRNQYHFSARRGWISDPCGFLYYEGKYHCYWWGCAESEDLIHFNEVSRFVQKDVPRGLGCWTGCVVADPKNTAGFGRDAYISCLTLNDAERKNQSQCLTVSHDHGRSFHYYDGNPVLDIGYQDFRDPTVIWHEESGQWLMVVSKTLESKAAFYASPDLKHWTWLSDFGPAGRTYRCFECPDFFQLTVDNGPKKGQKKWVLVVSVDWDNEQYFVGDFDGTTFHAEGLKQETGVYVDCGPDFYASRTFKDFDGTLGGKVYSMGWMSNWRYCRDLPMTYGKGFWSVPRELSLLDTPAGWRLVQRPKQELTTLRGTRQHYQGRLKQGRTVVKDVARLENVYEAEVSFDTSVSNTFGLNLCAGGGRKLVVTYDTGSHSLVVDRTQVADFEMTKFEHTCHAKVAPINGRLKLRIFVDKCCVEIFSEDGTSVFSLATFAADDHTALELFAHQPGTNYQLDVWPMTSIWPSVAQ